MFEQFVLELLDREVREQRGQIVSRAGTGRETLRHGFDAVLPAGLDDRAVPTAVDVKYFTAERRPSPRRLRESLLRLQQQAQLEGLGAILQVHAAPMTTALSRVVEEVQAQSNLRVEVWGLEELRSLSARYADDVPGTVSALALAPLRQALAEPDPATPPDQDGQLERLRRVYASEGLVLVLGAGVSIGAGLQDWNGLTGALFVAVLTEQLGQKIPEDHAQPLAALARGLNGDSPLLMARYLRRALEDLAPDEGDAFRDRLVQTLYEGARGSAGSRLLDAIVDIATPLRSGPKVHAVVTYNFDDLLEQALEARGVMHRSIYHEQRLANENELPVYHVHGFLPRRPEGFDRVDDALLAFSEEGYHQLYRDPYHWSNIVQLNAFRERSCLFLGLSMTDPNLRRLLDISSRVRDGEEPRHFAFLRRMDVHAIATRPEFTDVQTDRDALTAFLKAHHALQERLLGELGVTVVWFDEHDEMPTAVSRLMPRR